MTNNDEKNQSLKLSQNWDENIKTVNYTSYVQKAK